MNDGKTLVSSIVENNHYETLKNDHPYLDTWVIEAMEIFVGICIFTFIFYVFRKRKIKGQK